MALLGQVAAVGFATAQTTASAIVLKRDTAVQDAGTIAEIDVLANDQLPADVSVGAIQVIAQPQCGVVTAHPERITYEAFPECDGPQVFYYGIVGSPAFAEVAVTVQSGGEAVTPERTVTFGLARIERDPSGNVSEPAPAHVREAPVAPAGSPGMVAPKAPTVEPAPAQSAPIQSAGVAASSEKIDAPGRAPAPQVQSGPTVTITSPGGSAVTGELIEIDGAFYKLKTSLGVIEIDMTDATCVGRGCPRSTLEKFAIAGSPALGAELMPALVQGYAESLKAEIAFESRAGGGDQLLRMVDDGGQDLAVIALANKSDSSFIGVATRSAAIGMSSQKLTPEEVVKLQAAGIQDPRETDREHQIALDAVAVLVHPGNPVTSISLADLGAIYAGEITSWAAVGGPDRPIKLYAQDDQSAALGIFEQLVLDPAGKALADGVKRPGDSELADLVAVEPDAIALAGLAYVDGEKTLPIRQGCGLVTEPSLFAVKAGEYPLTRRLYLYEHPVHVAKHARSLLDFAISDAAQPVIAAARLVDRSLESSALAHMGAQFAHTLAGGIEAPPELFGDLVAELGGARRLSTTLRFVSGSIDLDAFSRQSLEVLVRQIRAGAFDGQEILLVGFSAADGAFDENLSRSQSRAEAVLDVLTRAVGPLTARAAGLQAKGYGGLMPVACDSDASGRELNRRVEVWLRPKRS